MIVNTVTVTAHTLPRSQGTRELNSLADQPECWRNNHINRILEAATLTPTLTHTIAQRCLLVFRVENNKNGKKRKNKENKKYFEIKNHYPKKKIEEKQRERKKRNYEKEE